MGIHKEIDRQNHEVDPEDVISVHQFEFEGRPFTLTEVKPPENVAELAAVICPECDRDNLNEAKTKCFDCEGIV